MFLLVSGIEQLMNPTFMSTGDTFSDSSIPSQPPTQVLNDATHLNTVPEVQDCQHVINILVGVTAVANIKGLDFGMKNV